MGSLDHGGRYRLLLLHLQLHRLRRQRYLLVRNQLAQRRQTHLKSTADAIGHLKEGGTVCENIIDLTLTKPICHKVFQIMLRKNP